MDSPLNLAHRCHRKAEQYLNEHRYQEAIDCHLKAAHHLTEALLETSCHRIKSSLEIQKSYHLSQERVLKERELCETNRLQTYKQELINRRLIREKFGLIPDRNHKQTGNMGPENSSFGADNKPNVIAEIMDVFTEHDSLLQVLIEKRKASQSSEASLETTATSSEPTTGVVNSPSNDSLYKSASKRPKDDKTIIEELQTVNEKLRQLVFQLYSDLEVTQNENQILKRENQRLRDENRNAISSTVPELPPLEPPELLY